MSVMFLEANKLVYIVVKSETRPRPDKAPGAINVTLIKLLLNIATLLRNGF